MSDLRKTSGTRRSRSGAIVSLAEVERRRANAAARQAERKAARAERKKACKHRGKRVSAADAYGPKGVTCCKLYECKLHGLCTLNRVLPEIACCAPGQCADYSAARRDTADDGRAG